MMRNLLLSTCLAGVLSAFAGAGASAAESVVLAPVPAIDAPLAKVHGTETVILSGGCFWGMQDVFQHVDGVKQAISGYTGGAASTAQYEIVSTGTTGHAESLKIVYDPARRQLRNAAARIRLRRGQPDRAGLPGAGPWNAVSQHDLGRKSGATQDRRRLYAATRRRTYVRCPHRNPGDNGDAVLSGRSLSSEFRDAASGQPLHRGRSMRPKSPRSRSCSRRFIARPRRRCASLRMVRGLR